jgi:hypothetical protein
MATSGLWTFSDSQVKKGVVLQYPEINMSHPFSMIEWLI